MSRYIDAESVKEKLGIAFYKAREWSENHQEGIAKAEIIIDQEPTADVAPVVHAKWIPVTNGRGGHKCSLCQCYAPSFMTGDEWLADYCPDCGAKMDEEKLA